MRAIILENNKTHEKKILQHIGESRNSETVLEGKKKIFLPKSQIKIYNTMYSEKARETIKKLGQNSNSYFAEVENWIWEKIWGETQ